jgi:hypothetical protein
VLQAGQTLADADGPHEIEVQLVRLMKQGVRQLVSREQYARLMHDMANFFMYCREIGVDAEQLQCRYAYVQAAVDGGLLQDVLDKLQLLLAL